MKLLDFLLARDCDVDLRAIQPPQLPFKSLLDVFERALEQEQEVSRQIDALYETAFNEKAFAAVAELQWFLTEQVEEEKTGREIVTKLKMVGDDPASLLDMDRELGTSARASTCRRRRRPHKLRVRPGFKSSSGKALPCESSHAHVHLALVLLAAACSKTDSPRRRRRPAARRSPASAAPITTMPKFEAGADARIAPRRCRPTSSRGARPGTKGEELTVKYLEDEFRKLGLKPGNTDGTYVQKVPLVGITGHEHPAADDHQGRGKSARSSGPTRSSRGPSTSPTAPPISDSDMIFAGYGVTAPEFNWDDFKDVDVKGKTIVVLVNDPQVPDPADPSKLDPKVFNGKAMTYYGRWTYKFEEGARRGAAGILIVHETGPAGYPFQVVQGNLREKFDLVTPDKNMGRASIEGWVTLDAAKADPEDGRAGLRRAEEAGADPRVQAGAARPEGVASRFENTMRTLDSKNVLAKVEGSDPRLRDEYVVYTAHWDHLGVGAPVNGDKIYNGALDNASGVAQLLEIARAFTSVEPKPKRSILFLMVTAEEQGLLGSQYYSVTPVYPLAKTARQHQRRRRQPVGPHEGHHRGRHGRVGSGRLPARRGRGTGPRAAPRSGTGEGLLLPLGSLQLRQAGRAGALHRHAAMEFIGKPPGLQQAEARRIHRTWTTTSPRTR